MNDTTRTITLDWTGGIGFRGGSAGVPPVELDGDVVRAPGPMHQLLVALAGCAGADVVSILPKMKVDLTTCRIEASGERHPEPPRRYVSLHLHFHLAGSGLDEVKARRAITLSLETYCSVRHSLDPSIPLTWDLTLA